MAEASQRQSGRRKAGKHFANGRVASTPKASPSAEGVSPVTPVKTDSFDEAAPRPVDDSTGSFERLSSTEGAVMGADAVQHEHDQEQNDDSQQPGRGFTVILAIAIAVVIAAGFYFFARSCSSEQPQQQQQTVTEQTQTNADESIDYRGATYSLATNDAGTYVLRETNEASGTESTVDLVELEGTPTKLVLYNGAFIMPENKGDGTWDVISYTIGSGAAPLSDQEGNAYSGQGTISDAELDGSNLNLTIDGSQQVIPLEW